MSEPWRKQVESRSDPGSGWWMEEKCHVCEKTIDEASLLKCPMCFRYTCVEHTTQRSGRSFCSKPCSDYFFFADADD